MSLSTEVPAGQLAKSALVQGCIMAVECLLMQLKSVTKVTHVMSWKALVMILPTPTLLVRVLECGGG